MTRTVNGRMHQVSANKIGNHPLAVQALVIFVLTFVLYAMTLSRNFTGDSIQFARIIEAENVQEMFETHQILMHPIGWVFYHTWQILGWQGSSLLPLQILNALTGACSVLFLYLISQKITQSSKISILTACGFALSAGIWIFSTEAEFVTIPLALTLFLLWWTIRTSPEERQRPTYLIKLGIGVGLATLTYITNIFLALILLPIFLRGKDQTWKFQLRQIVIFSLSVILTILPIFLIVLYLIFDVRNLQSLQNWQLYRGEGQLYGGIPAMRDFAQGAYTFLRTFFAFPGIGLQDRTSFYIQNASGLQKAVFALFYGGVLLLVLSPILLGFFKRREILGSKNRIVAMLTIWFLIYASFAIYWVPSDPQFWVPATVSWWLFSGIVLSGLNLKKTVPFIGRAVRSWSEHIVLERFIAGLILIMFLINGLGLIFVNHNLDNNSSYSMASMIMDETSENDLILTTGGDPLFLYIPYFADRNTISVFHTILAANNDKAEAFEIVEAKIADTKAGGGRVFLVGVEPGLKTWWDVLSDVNLYRDDFKRFKTEPYQVVAGETILEVVP